MALTIEDGTGVVGATSYVTLAEAKSYASARGLVFLGPDGVATATDPQLEVLLVKAVDYLESRRARYKGAKVGGSGYLQWPRINADGTAVVIDGTALAVPPAVGSIPVELKAAQCQLAFEIATVDPLPTTTGPAIRQETLDVISTTYAVSDNAGQVLPVLPKVEALLKPLYKNASPLMSVRI